MRPSRIYLCGSSRELERVRLYEEGLRGYRSIEVVSTWTQTAHEWAGKDARLTREEQEPHARQDLRELESADIVWCLWPTGPSYGAFVELGYAIALCKCLVISGPTCSESVFSALANYRDADDACAYREVLRIVSERLAPIERVQLGETR